MRSLTNQFYFAIAVLVSLCALRMSAQGRSTVDDYANRLDRAEQMVKEAIEGNSAAPELATIMSEVKRLLPAREEVDFDGATTHINNAWLHEAADKLVKNAEVAAADKLVKNAEVAAEDRLRMLGEISARLARLRQSVKSARRAEAGAAQDQRARLDGILARPEYQPEDKRESTIMRWIRRIKEFIFRLLRILFDRPSARSSQTGGGEVLIIVLRALIVLVATGALIFGAAKLARRFQARRKPAEKAKTREALGEEIPEDATAEDLFAMASELAGQGEYRKAIRRAYIALLCELDQRDKLRLGRSKTNRDYLDAMRSERLIYPTFSVMTLAFERAWYGQERATEEEFRNFVTLYQEAVK